MPNYQNGKIYVIRSPHTDKICIGSTTQSLSQRLTKHKSDFKRHAMGQDCFRTSFHIFQAGDAYIELLENFPCNSVEELCAREYHHIRQAGDRCANKMGAFKVTLPPPPPAPQSVLDLMNEIVASE